MRTFLVATSLFTLCICNSMAQKKDKLYIFNTTEFGVYYGSRYELEKDEFHEYVVATHIANIISIRNIRGWLLSEKFALGLGIGYDGIIVKGASNPDQLIEDNGDYYYTYKYTPGTFYHTIPLFGQTRFYFRKNIESAYLFTDFGSFLNLNSSIKRSLLLWGLGIGQRHKLKSGTMITLGLDFQERYLIGSSNDKQRIPSLGLKVGMEF